MEHFKDLYYEDASRYFNNTIAVHKETSECCLVNVEEGDDGYPLYYVNRPQSSSAEELEADEFFDNYYICKFELGWLNFEQQDHYLARYVTAVPARRMSKGYRFSDFSIESPYERTLRQIADRVMIDSQPPDDPYSKVSEETYQKVDRIMKHARSLRMNGLDLSLVMGTLTKPFYYTVDDVLSNFSGTPSRSGMAMSRAFAACLNTANYGSSAALYYHTKQVGFVDSGIHIYAQAKHLVPEFVRTLGVEPTIHGEH